MTPQRPGATPDTPEIRVCVIDDDAGVRDLVSRVLRRACFMTVEAEDGMAGLAAVESSQADIVVTDMTMPNGSGSHVISELKRRFPKVRILAMSGGDVGGRNFRDVATELGAHDCLPKPFRLADLVGKVSALALAGGL
jgi:DNA-binding response OmpR family regulator